MLERWLLRSRRGGDITISGAGMEGQGLDILRRWQREFQDEFCSSCARAPYIPADGRCPSHHTDVIGVCWNFRDQATGDAIGDLAVAAGLRPKAGARSQEPSTQGGAQPQVAPTMLVDGPSAA